MASNQQWCEYNNSGGMCSETQGVTNMNWKNVDDCTTTYSNSPIAAGNASYQKYQSLLFGGSWNSLSALQFSIDGNAAPANVTFIGAVVSSWTTPINTVPATPDPSLLSGSTPAVLSSNFCIGTFISNAHPTTGPFQSGTSSLSNGTQAYSQVLRTQMYTNSNAAAGDIAQRTFTATWTES